MKRLYSIFIILVLFFGVSVLFSNSVEATDENARISDGTYVITSALNSKMVVEVDNGKQFNGANVHLWEYNGSFNQKFEFKYVTDGYYEIKAVHSGKLMDVANEGKVNGTNVQQCERTNCDAQRWFLKDSGDGYYSIVSRCNGLSFDVAWALARNGSNIQLCEGTENNNAQRFSLRKVEEIKPQKTLDDGVYQIKSALNENYVLDVTANSKVNGANVELFQNNGGMNQKFIVKYLNDGYYQITAYHSNKLLDVKNEGMRNGTNVQQCENTNSNAQKWIIRDCGDGYYNVIAKCNGLFLDVEWAWARNGSNIQLCEGTDNNRAQKFSFQKINQVIGEKTVDDGIYQIKSALDENYVLDVQGAYKWNGANIELWKNNNGMNQKFDVKYIGSGYYEIKALHSGKLLDVKNEGQVNGTNIQQCENTDSNAQKFVIRDCGNGYYSIIAKCNELYLDVAWGLARNGSNIQMCEGTKNNYAQMFKFVRTNATETGTYGKSGRAYKGQAYKSELNYYRYGYGENVYFALFAVHGFEDNWNYDGQELVNIANDFYNRLVAENSEYIAKNWSVYVIPTVNPDGVYYGWTNNGPGRTTLYSKAPGGKGIDINRSWEIPGVTYKRYTDNRNYNGTAGFQTYEAEALRSFLINNKSQSGQTVLIDLHGWENSFIGDEEIGSRFFAPNFPSATKKYNSYGNQYLITWARSVLGARSALVELPNWIGSHQEAVNNQLSKKYSDSVIDMLKNISIGSSVRKVKRAVKANRAITDEEQFDIAFAGMMKRAVPSEGDIIEYKDKLPSNNGVWIDEGSKDYILELINGLTNSEYGVDEDGYLCVLTESESVNDYDEFVNGLISSDGQYILASTGNLYYRDIVSYEIDCSDYEEHDGYQTYDYVQSGDKFLIDVSTNSKGKLTDKEIFDSVIRLVEE